MMLQRVMVKVETLGDLPTLPEVVLSIRRVAADDHTSAADLANVILQDAALSGKVLKLVNASFYRQTAGRISTVTRAIVILGFTAVQDLAMGLKVQEMLGRVGNRARLKAFWTLSLGSALCTRQLALKAGYPSPEEAFVAALLQDVGQIMLEHCFPEEYAKVLEKSGEARRLAAEQEFLKVDHAQVGEALARLWNLPGRLETVLADHHRQTAAAGKRHSEPLVDLVFVGHLMALQALDPSGKESDRTHLMSAAQQLLGLDKGDVQSVLSPLIEHLEEVASRLEISISVPHGDPAHKGPGPKRRKTTEAGGPHAHGDRELEMLHEISGAIVHGMGLEPLLQLVLECTFTATRMDRVLIFLAEGDQLVGRLGFGLPAAVDVKSLVLPASQGQLAAVLSSGRVAHLAAADAAKLLPETLLRALGTVDMALAPLVLGGELKGLLYADNAISHRAIPEDAVRILGGFANQAVIALGLRG